MIGHRPRVVMQAGFSLVELVVAIAIGGLLLALVFNGQSLVANRRLTGTARKLASDLRMLEQRARAERTCYRMVFSPSGETYDILRYNGTVRQPPAGGGNQCTDAAWSGTPEFREDSGDTVSRRMPTGVDLVSTSFAADTLTFSALGNANAGTAILRTASGQERQVVLDVMGRVRILP